MKKLLIYCVFITLISCDVTSSAQLKGKYVWEFKRVRAKHVLILKSDSSLIVKNSILDRKSPKLLKSKGYGTWSVFNDSLLIINYKMLSEKFKSPDTLSIIKTSNAFILKDGSECYIKK